MIIMKNISELLSDIVYKHESDVKNLDKMVTDVVELLKTKGKIISCAESCTGGLISQLITSVPGSSSTFELGLCTYSNDMKHKLLNVPTDTLNNFGAVSSQTALAMTDGLALLSGADVCVSVTGIAGPDGGTPQKPIGTVYAGFLFGNLRFAKLLKLWNLPDGSRNNIRYHTALCVFEILRLVLEEGKHHEC